MINQQNSDHESTTPDVASTRSAKRADKRAGKRSGVAMGLAGGLLAGTAAGLVFGVPGPTSAARSAPLVAVAQQVDDAETPTTPADEAPEMGVKLRETLQALVDDGTITAEQADAVTAHLVENRPERPDRGDRDGAGRGGERGGPGMFGRGVGSEALTDLLGLDAQELREQLRDGSTLADIAEAQGIDPQAVVDELVAELTERVDNAVENGRLDQVDADAKLADAEAKITDQVDNGRD